jgi:Alkylmercury lyase
MLLFRSEEEIEAWCAQHGRKRGGVVPIARLHELATRWYGDRLDPGWRPRSTEQSQAILDGVRLTGPFWHLTAPNPRPT